MQKPRTIGATTIEVPRSSCALGYGYRHQQFRARLLNERMEKAAIADESPCSDCADEGESFRLPAWPLHLHHIEKVADRPELRFEPTNCTFLCRAHHQARTNRGE